MEEHGNNGIFGVDRKQMQADGREKGNLFGVALVGIAKCSYKLLL